MTGAFWPYLVVVLVGFLPNEAFRVGAVLLSRSVDERSEVFAWIRVVAVSLLAAVVSKLVYAPSGALLAVPLWVRGLSLVIGVAAFFASRRRLILGLLAGEGFLVTLAWWLGDS